ncbi:MAG: GlsB/YeaQ/YmgE family stress response membrane protein [Nocardioides sp.]|nr:GlsB/YeaQ/YmgE family stress response membrane protein [Nocardioides sp.]
MIGFLVAGLIIGALARLFKPGRQNLSILMTLLLGVVGSVIGGVIASAIGTGDIMELNVIGFVVAVIAAVLLIGAAESLSGKDKAHV